MKPGDVVGGKYVLRELIGAGGMGSVFLADQPALARPVTVKILHPELVTNRVLARRFREEAVAASRVRHPRSVTVIDCSQLPDGTPYIVYEHVPGRTVGRLIAEEEVSVARAVMLVDQMLGALAAAHAAGVIHADVKSDNFLVEEIGGADHVTLIDFGLARVDGATAASELDGQMVSGTPEYLAPEVIRGGAPLVASDLYAVGIVLYELLTGTTPFAGGSSREVMDRQLEDVVVPPSLRQPDRGIPDAIDRVVLRALEKEPEKRFASAEHLAQALRSALPVYRKTGRTSRRIPAVQTETPTQPRLARGSDISGGDRSAQIESLRRAIGHGMIRGHRPQITQAYLQLAEALAADQRGSEAIRELREGIDVLSATSREDGCVAQLSTALAALLG